MSAAATICALPSSPCLRGFRCALERDWLRDAIVRHLLVDGELVAARPEYVRYKALQGALVGWHVELATAAGRINTFVTVRAAPLPRLRTEAARLASRADETYFGLRAVCLREDDEVLLLAFPVDRILRDLRGMLRASRVRTLVLGARPELFGGRRIIKHHSHAELLRYKPERRAVLRWSLGLADAGDIADTAVASCDVFVRVHADAVVPGAVLALRAAHAAGIRCPQPLALAHDRLVVESAVPGAPLQPGDSAALRDAGRCLAALHTVAPPEGLGLRTAVHELDAVLDVCNGLRDLDPALGERAGAVAECLSRWVPPTPSLQLLHGDFHRGQILRDAAAIGLVDFDRAALGSAALDLAAFYAHELVADPTGAESVSGTLAQGYAEVAPLPEPSVLAWYRACAVTRAAMTPFRVLHPHWPERGHALLAAAERLAAAGE